MLSPGRAVNVNGAGMLYFLKESYSSSVSTWNKVVYGMAGLGILFQISA